MLTSAPPVDNVGLVVALSAEARSLGLSGMHPGACTRWAHGWVALSGVGPDCAARATQHLLERGVTRLANWGIAGALAPSLEPGDVVIPDRILCADNGEDGFTPDLKSRAHLANAMPGPHVHRGVLCSVAQAAVTHSDKQALAARTGAIAVDMEAAAVAAIATRAGLPFIAVKAICDPLRREVPERVAHALAAHAGFSLALLSAITFGGPATWRAARELARDFACARRALATASRLAAFSA